MADNLINTGPRCSVSFSYTN